MTLEADIRMLLDPLVFERVYPDVAPLSTQRPYITYQQIGGDVIDVLGQEVPDKVNAMLQINVWADTRVQASALANQIEVAMIQATAFRARPLSAFAGDHDEDMNIYGTRQDFSVWRSRNT